MAATTTFLLHAPSPALALIPICVNNFVVFFLGCLILDGFIESVTQFDF